MVLGDDKILTLDERGTLHLIRANPNKFELLDSVEHTRSPAWGNLAVAGDEVFVRELNAMTAYRVERSDSKIGRRSSPAPMQNQWATHSFHRARRHEFLRRVRRGTPLQHRRNNTWFFSKSSCHAAVGLSRAG